MVQIASLGPQLTKNPNKIDIFNTRSTYMRFIAHIYQKYARIPSLSRFGTYIGKPTYIETE